MVKCADGETLGGIPRCPKCGGGYLRFDQRTGIYKCPGYRDDDEYVNCNGTFTRAGITRAKWETPS